MAETKIDIHREIIEECKKGNRKAQYQLYQLYSKAMFNICMRMLNNHEEAEDVLQESFTDAFRRLDSFRFESTFGAWLKRLTVNHCINALKRRKVNFVLQDNSLVFDSVDNNDVVDDESRQYTEYTVAKIHKALELLPEGGRVVFSLYLLEGYDHGEIAEILNISESTSKSQFLRAKRKVAELVKQMN